jgi:hypothetical protein
MTALETRTRMPALAPADQREQRPVPRHAVPTRGTRRAPEIQGGGGRV